MLDFERMLQLGRTSEPVPPALQAVVDQSAAAVRDNRLDGPQAAAEGRCAAPPMGCGQSLPDGLSGSFRDEKSRREYDITHLCQTCQDVWFAPDPEEIAELEADPSWVRCEVCGEYRELQFVDVGVGVISGHDCCAGIRFRGEPGPPKCTRVAGCVFGADHVLHCEPAS